MKDYIFDVGNRLKAKSQKLDASAILCNKTWRVYSDSTEKEVYIFMTDGSLIVSNNGSVDMGRWMYIPTNQSLVITSSRSNVLVHPILINKLLVLITDGTENCSFLIDKTETELEYVTSLNSFTKYIEEHFSDEVISNKTGNDSKPKTISSPGCYAREEDCKMWTYKAFGLTEKMYHIKWINRQCGNGFDGVYRYGCQVLKDTVDNRFSAIIPSGIEGHNTESPYFSLFKAEFDSYKERGDKNLISLEYLKLLDSEDYYGISVKRMITWDNEVGLFGRVRKTNFHPCWICEFYPSDTWRKTHNDNSGNVYISIAEWMSRFGRYFWADVDINQKFLSNFLGTSAFSFFEAEKWR